MSLDLTLIRLGFPALGLLLVLVGSAAAAQLTLTWLGVDGAMEYAVEREEASSGWFVEIGRAPGSVPGYVDTTVLGLATYCYRVRAASLLGYSEYSNVACAAAPAGAGSLADDFSRPDSSTLGNGWTTVSGALAIRSGEVRNATTATMHAAVQGGLAGSTQSVSARFAVVDLTSSSRFGVLVRYRDPKNYYVCYRQTGGASVLRLSRVVNGVETILKSASISNPLKDQFSTIGCQAQGTTLTMSLNGTSKLTASDSAFATGSVGLAMGPPPGGTGATPSNRADAFKAVVQEAATGSPRRRTCTALHLSCSFLHVAQAI